MIEEVTCISISRGDTLMGKVEKLEENLIIPISNYLATGQLPNHKIMARKIKLKAPTICFSVQNTLQEVISKIVVKVRSILSDQLYYNGIP